MNESTQRRFSRIVNIAYLAILLGFAYLFMKYCFGIVFPFIFAFFIAMIVQKPTNAIYKKTGHLKGVTSTILVLLLLVIGVSLVSLVGAKVVTTCRDFIAYLIERVKDFPSFITNVEKWISNVISVLPDAIEAKISASVTRALERFEELTVTEAASLLMQAAASSDKIDVSSISSIVSPIGGGVWSVVKEIPSVLVASLVSVIACCFMAADYDMLVGFVKRQIHPRHSEALSKSKGILLTTLKQLLKAYGTIMIVTFSEMTLGLYILKLIGIYNSEYILLIAAITALVDIVPVLGTGTILIPWALYSLLNANIPFAIGLVVIYVVILVIRQVLEPKLVATKLGLPPVITIAAMYIGTQLFGFVGLFLLPITLIMVKKLNDEGIIHLWNPSVAEEEKPQTEEITETAEVTEAIEESETEATE
ncbi:MAG: AI-2E family transporter [Clostridia bacterium]|nr:AI-2E family transporter [Clostridia bacterium]